MTCSAHLGQVFMAAPVGDEAGRLPGSEGEESGELIVEPPCERRRPRRGGRNEGRQLPLERGERCPPRDEAANPEHSTEDGAYCGAGTTGPSSHTPDR